MNSVELSGRLTRDPDIRYTTNSQTCVASFTLAVDRHDKDKSTDFPRVKAFGRLGEIVEKYCKQGKTVEVRGELQTGSYDGKNGKVYTTEVVIDKLVLCPDARRAAEQKPEAKPEPKQEPEAKPEPTQEQFEEIDDDVPF